MATQTTPDADARAVVTDCLRRLARSRARLDALSADLEGELLAVRRRRQGPIARLQRRIDSMLSELEAYCRAERDSVLPANRKSLVTPFGEVRFRRTAAALLIEEGAEEEVCAALRARDLADLVHVRESVDRRALRAALQEGRLTAKELPGLGLRLVDREDAFGCKLRRDALLARGGQGT